MDLITATPPNLSIDPKVRAAYVDNDMYNICERVREIDPSLRIVHLADGDKHSFSIVEHCSDGIERLVFKVKELDGRVIERLRKIMAKPLTERVKELEAQNKAFEEAQRELEFEKLYEEMGRPMWTELEKTGFIQRNVSYPKAGVATKGKKTR